jgi:hypothetical protein
MVSCESAEIGDIKGMLDEVTLRVTEVSAIKPRITLVVNAIELDPATLATQRFRRIEVVAIENWAVGVGKLRM